MKPTIYTIAAQAGVSIATISRAFNNSPRISESTRLRILQIAAEIGYQPNASARNLALNATETLALVFPQISTPFFSEFIRGAEHVARHHNYHLLVYSSPLANEEDPLLRILPSRTDGIVLGTHYNDTVYIHQLHQQGFPFLVLGRVIPELEVDGIHPDNEGGAYQLTRHLLEVHGYRSIAYISGPDDQPHNHERLVGFRRAFAEAGLPFDPAAVVPGNFDETGGYLAAQKLLKLAAPPRAIFAGNDQTAIGVLSAAAELGYQIPKDLAIVGFDDIPAARYLQPPLTTVNQSVYEQGVKAVEILLQKIADPTRPAEICPIPTHLVIRRSCGCREQAASLPS